MRLIVDGRKVGEVLRRLEQLYAHCHLNGGPDLEVRAIQRLLTEEVLDDAGEDDQFVTTETPRGPAA
jgi:hypothetical protein